LREKNNCGLRINLSYDLKGQFLTIPTNEMLRIECIGFAKVFHVSACSVVVKALCYKPEGRGF
jgi:hypothetical protein